ncbi:MAG TPA: proton-conducting transporter membrane subunit [Egibacteraceae bacterium]|nr:Na+/H+ antiporter subunit D [Actinomycetota bacterium]HWB72032.1 proton-conducting transporter membrane subunit [Egibacteraceae bacterium]
MNVLVPLPVALPLLAAAASMALRRRPGAQRFLGVAAMTATLAAAVAVVDRVRLGGPTAVQIGGWSAPFGITLVADLFAAIMVTLGAAMVLIVLVYAIGHPRTRDQAPFFHPVYLILAAGVSASFLAGDLFNLFVAFEVMLTASYVLLTLEASPEQVRGGMTYVVVSLLASTLFITAVALVYAATGTVNMADLAGRLALIDPALRAALGLLLLVVFGVKAAIFPLFFWLPDAYPTAVSPITAVFAGLLTKVGVYAIIRTQTLLFAPPEAGPSTLLLAIAGATMVIGILGAIVQEDLKRIFSFNLVSHIGFMVMGLGFFTVAGLAAAIYYIVHHVIVKTSLFLVGGVIEQVAGTGALHRLGGSLRRSPATAALFAVPALSLAGLPPFSGFVAKVALVQAGLAAEQAVIVGVSLAVSLLTLLSMSKIWTGVFWGGPEDIGRDNPLQGSAPRPMVAATAVLVTVSVVVGFGAGPLYDLSVAAAEQLAPRRYVEAVLVP